MKSKQNIHNSLLGWGLVAFLVIIFQFPSAFAANEGPPIQISKEVMDQQNPDVVALPDKGLWFVVWEDWRTAADPPDTNTGADIWGQFTNEDGSLCGDPFLISDENNDNKGDPGNQTFPSVAYDQDPGRLLVTWQDTRATEGTESTNIYARGINVTDCSNYTILDEQTMSYNPIFVGSDLLSRSRPRVAYDSTRDYFWLAWSEDRSARKTVTGYAFGCNSTSFGWTVGDTSFVGYAALDSNPTGNALPETVIPDIPHTGDTINIRLMSRAIGCTKDVITYEFHDVINNVDVAADPSSGEVLLVWEGIERTLTVTNSSMEADGCPSDCFDCGCDPIESTSVTDDAHNGIVHIYGIHYKHTELSEIRSLLFSDPESLAYMPSVKADPVTGRFLTAWEDLRDGPLYTKIYGQLVYAGGGLYNTNFIIGYQDTNGDGEIDEPLRVSRQTGPYVGYDHTNQRFFTAWQDGRNGSVSVENLDIYGQYVDAEGSLRGSNYLLSCSSAGSPAEGNQYSPAIAFNMGNHLFLAVWKDARNYTDSLSDIYGQRFTIGQPQLTVLNVDGSILSPALIDFSSRLVGEEASASFKVRNTGDVILDLQNFSAFGANSAFQYVGLPSEMSDGDQDGITLVPSGEFTVTVKFAPLNAGSFHNDILISSDAGEVLIHLQGLGLEQAPTTSSVSVNPSEISFGSVAIGDVLYQNVVIQNDGNTDVHLITVEEPVSPFSTLGAPSSGAFAPNSSMNFSVKFAPESGDTYSSRIVFIFEETNPVIIEINGECSTTLENPEIVISSTDITFENTIVETARSIHLTISNTGNGPATLLRVDKRGDAFDVTDLDAGQTIGSGQIVHSFVIFTPSEEESFDGEIALYFAHEMDPQLISLHGRGVSEEDYQGPDEDQQPPWMDPSSVQGADADISTSSWLDLRLVIPQNDLTDEFYVLVEHPSLLPGQVYAYQCEDRPGCGPTECGKETNCYLNLFSQWGHLVPGAANLSYKSDRELDLQSNVLSIPFGGFRLIGLEDDIIIQCLMGTPRPGQDWGMTRLLRYTLHVLPLKGLWIVTDQSGTETFTYSEPLILDEYRGLLEGTWMNTRLGWWDPVNRVDYVNPSDALPGNPVIIGSRVQIVNASLGSGYDLHFQEWQPVWGENLEYWYQITDLEKCEMEGTWKWRMVNEALWSVPQPFTAVRIDGDICSELYGNATDMPGQRGEVEVGLHWTNYNDLDLHVIDPEGEEIYFAHTTSASGGELDVDANAGCGGNRTQDAWEHIVWVSNPPSGQYEVKVNYFAQCEGAPETSSFEVIVRIGGEETSYSGTVSTVGETVDATTFQY